METKVPDLNIDITNGTNGPAQLAASSQAKIAIPREIGEPLEELRRQGKVVKKTIVYNPQAHLRCLLSFAGTALQMVMKSPDFYLIMLVHIAFVVLYYSVSGVEKTNDGKLGAGTGEWPWIASATFSIPGSLIVFFLVFHTNQSYNRFFTQYAAVKRAEGRIGQVSFILRTIFPDEAFPGARDTRNSIIRKLIAVHYLGFGWLPQYREAGLTQWAWERCVDTHLLTPSEAAELQDLPPGVNPIREIMLWVCQTLYTHVRQEHIQVANYNNMQEYLFDIIGQFGKLYMFTSMPVPFAFFHLLNLMLIAYLLLLAYTYAYLTYYYSIIGMLLTTVALLGLRELSNALADPFGKDPTDLPVFDYVVANHAYLIRFINEPPLFVKKGEDAHVIDDKVILQQEDSVARATAMSPAADMRARTKKVSKFADVSSKALQAAQRATIRSPRTPSERRPSASNVELLASVDGNGTPEKAR